MYPEFTRGNHLYSVDQITPFIGIILFVVIVYLFTKSNNLRFRDIITKLPFLIIGTILFGTYSNFVIQSGEVIPKTRQYFSSLLILSVDTIDFIGVVIGYVTIYLIILHQLPYKLRNQWGYVLLLSSLALLVVLGILYTLGDSVIGRFNDGFFSIGSFGSNSRISQIGGSVYPVGLLISGRSLLCLVAGWYMARYGKYHKSYFIGSLFFIGYIVILHYQHYPRHLIVNLGFLQMDIRSYLCIGIACIATYLGYNVKQVHRFVPITHEDSVGKTG